MRILRSQYLKQQAKQQLQISNTSTTSKHSEKTASSIETRSRSSNAESHHKLKIATNCVTQNDKNACTQRSDVHHYALSIPSEGDFSESPINVTLTLGEDDKSTDATEILTMSKHHSHMLSESQKTHYNTSVKSVAPASLNIVRQRQYSLLIPCQAKHTSSEFCYTLPKSDEGSSGVSQATAQNFIENELRINIDNAGTNRFSKINVVVQVYSVDAKWFTRFYNIHKEKFWMKVPRNGLTKSTKWYFKCRVCERQLCSFGTLKFHLNRHVGFIPYRCKRCGKGYAGANSFYKHNRTKHVNYIK